MGKVLLDMQGALESHCATGRRRDSSRRMRSRHFFTKTLGSSVRAKEVAGLKSDIRYLVDS